MKFRRKLITLIYKNSQQEYCFSNNFANKPFMV